MTQTEKIETKELIINQARQLFSQHGFKGTSVRKIAESSGVNLAAINYHFGSKEILYWFVILGAMEWLDSSVKEVVSASETIEDIAVKLFRKLHSDSDYVTTTMKTFLSDLVPPPDDDHPYVQILKQPQMGPPGWEHIVNFMKEKHPDSTEDAQMWLVHCLFANIIHMTTMTSSSHYENIKSKFIPLEEIEMDIKIMSTALLNHATKKDYWNDYAQKAKKNK